MCCQKCVCVCVTEMPRQGVDIEKDMALHNLATTLGFLFGIRQVLRLVHGGLATFAYPCNSWSFMSSSQHARSACQPWGNLQFAFVHMGNLLSTRATLLWALAMCRSALCMIENPKNSKLPLHPLLAHIRSFVELGVNDVKWSGPCCAAGEALCVCAKRIVLLLTCTYMYNIYIYITDLQVHGALWGLECETGTWHW